MPAGRGEAALTAAIAFSSHSGYPLLRKSVALVIFPSSARWTSIKAAALPGVFGSWGLRCNRTRSLTLSARASCAPCCAQFRRMCLTSSLGSSGALAPKWNCCGWSARDSAAWVASARHAARYIANPGFMFVGRRDGSHDRYLGRSRTVSPNAKAGPRKSAFCPRLRRFAAVLGSLLVVAIAAALVTPVIAAVTSVAVTGFVVALVVLGIPVLIVGVAMYPLVALPIAMAVIVSVAIPANSNPGRCYTYRLLCGFHRRGTIHASQTGG